MSERQKSLHCPNGNNGAEKEHYFFYALEGDKAFIVCRRCGETRKVEPTPGVVEAAS